MKTFVTIYMAFVALSIVKAKMDIGVVLDMRKASNYLTEDDIENIEPMKVQRVFCKNRGARAMVGHSPYPRFNIDFWTSDGKVYYFDPERREWALLKNEEKFLCLGGDDDEHSETMRNCKVPNSMKLEGEPSLQEPEIRCASGSRNLFLARCFYGSVYISRDDGMFLKATPDQIEKYCSEGSIPSDETDKGKRSPEEEGFGGEDWGFTDEKDPGSPEQEGFGGEDWGFTGEDWGFTDEKDTDYSINRRNGKPKK